MTAESDRIRRLLEDPDLQQAFQDVRDKLHEAFASSRTDDVEMLVDIRKRLHLLDAVEQALYVRLETGQLEDFRAAEEERPPFLGDILKWRKKQSVA